MSNPIPDEINLSRIQNTLTESGPVLNEFKTASGSSSLVRQTTQAVSEVLPFKSLPMPSSFSRQRECLWLNSSLTSFLSLLTKRELLKRKCLDNFLSLLLKNLPFQPSASTKSFFSGVNPPFPSLINSQGTPPLAHSPLLLTSFTSGQESIPLTSLPGFLSSQKPSSQLGLADAPPSSNHLTSSLQLKRKKQASGDSSDSQFKMSDISPSPSKKLKSDTHVSNTVEKSNQKIKKLETRKPTKKELEAAKQECIEGKKSPRQIFKDYAKEGIYIPPSTLYTSKQSAKRKTLLESGTLEKSSRHQRNEAQNEYLKGEKTAGQISRDYAANGIHMPASTLRYAKRAAEKDRLLESGALKSSTQDQRDEAKKEYLKGEKTAGQISREYAEQGIHIPEATLKTIKRTAFQKNLHGPKRRQ